MTDALQCYSCGRSLDDVLQPLVRSSTCPACDCDLHVCRMCEYYAPSVAKSCREPVAEEVRDKTRANFCDYFRARAGAHAADDAAREAKSALNALFGVDDAAPPASTTPDADALEQRKKQEADKADDELRRLFGLDEES